MGAFEKGSYLLLRKSLPRSSWSSINKYFLAVLPEAAQPHSHLETLIEFLMIRILLGNPAGLVQSSSLQSASKLILSLINPNWHRETTDQKVAVQACRRAREACRRAREAWDFISSKVDDEYLWARMSLSMQGVVYAHAENWWMMSWVIDSLGCSSIK